MLQQVDCSIQSAEKEENETLLHRIAVRGVKELEELYQQ
jgi:hypothetical protein